MSYLKPCGREQEDVKYAEHVLRGANPLHRFDRRLREPKELEQIFGVPVIGVIPESQALKGTRNAGGARKPSAFSAPIISGKPA